MKCMECYTEHPLNDWPWKKYDYPVYWSLPDDGAPFHCHDCGAAAKASEVYLTQIPCGHRLVVHKECIDKYWLSIAKDLGCFKE